MSAKALTDKDKLDLEHAVKIGADFIAMSFARGANDILHRITSYNVCYTKLLRPYVKAIQKKLVRDSRELMDYGVKCVAIMSNDPADYPEDSFDNMKRVAEKLAYPFPYLFDETQDVARAYGAVCTPDFFGYNADLELQYRGRLDASRTEPAPEGSRRDLFEAMKQIAETGKRNNFV